MATRRCPNCGAARAHVFHHIAGVPVNSCLLFTDREQAASVPRADIELAFCPACSFIFNAAWTPERTIYSDLYEETQGFSPTYTAFQRRLAEELISRYAVTGKQVVEIGCGKGDFLSLLCELGHNQGVGYDPSFIPGRRSPGTANVVFKQEYFRETTAQDPVDLVCCRMTLEHIYETRRFVLATRRIASAERGTVVFFQIPDVRRILNEAAFWDVYYEHCCYFSPGSLAHLFSNAGFEVLRIGSDFDSQYLTVEARPTEETIAFPPAPDAAPVEELAGSVAAFATAAAHCADGWASRIRAAAASGKRSVLWGSGSKAVAFLSATNVAQDIEYLVDINPYRWGKFVPGTAKQIVGPDFLSGYQPGLVIVMNPIYRREIADHLVRLGCAGAELCALGDSPVDAVPAMARAAA